MGRANRLLAPRVRAIATSFARRARSRPGARRQGDAAPAIRCGRRSLAAAHDALSAARPRRTAAPAGVRRQPGRARHGRHRAGGDRAAAALQMRGCRVVQQARAEDLARGPRRSMRALRRAGRGRAVLHRSAGADRRVPSRRSRARAPRPWPNSRRSAGRRSWCRCRMRSTRTRRANAGVLHGGRRRSGSTRAMFTPERLADEIADARRRARTGSRRWPRRAPSALGRIDAAERLADLVLQVGRPHRTKGSSSHETAARHRPDPFRRHRRHRHERHRRGAAQSRLHGAGLRRRRQRQRQAPARQGHHGRRSATTPRTSAAPRWWSSPSAIKRDNPELVGRARQAPAGGAPRRDAGRADAAEAAASPSAAPTARPRRPRWSRRCSTPAASTRP